MHGLILRIRCLPRIRRPAITGKSRLWQGQVMSSNKAGLGPALNRCAAPAAEIAPARTALHLDAPSYR
jgi:hypothetical protein